MRFKFDERPSDSPFIERIWRTQGERTGMFISQAKSYGEIVVTSYRDRTRITVRGPETKPTMMDYRSIGAEFFGIVFKLGTFMPHLPPAELRDQHDVNLPRAGSRSFWLYGSAWQFPDYENADTFVDRLVREGLLVHDPVVEAVRRGHSLQVSPRTVQYRFLRATGLTQKIIQQIERARYATSLLEQGASIPDTVYMAGYFDQSHLTNSLRRFMGLTPAQILQGDDT